MGNFLSPPEKPNPIRPPNGRILECDRCKTPASVGVRCGWCFEYPEIDKKWKFRDDANRPNSIRASVTDTAAYVCQSDECSDLGHDVVAVGICTWCGKFETESKFPNPAVPSYGLVYSEAIKNIITSLLSEGRRWSLLKSDHVSVRRRRSLSSRRIPVDELVTSGCVWRLLSHLPEDKVDLRDLSSQAPISCGFLRGMHCSMLIVLFWILIPSTSSSWWFLPQMRVLALGSSSSPAMCDLMPGLSRYQRRMCRMNPEAMNAVREGVRQGILECQRQFVNYRWNCSTTEGNGAGRIVLKPGSAESAFVYAITSAGVVFSIAKSCNRGELGDCQCDKRWLKGRGSDAQGDFLWGGCSDNIPYATDFARRFIDAKDRTSRDARSLLNMHNNQVGRKAVRRSPEKRCKCHGVSGSCVTRTCWWSLPKFGTIGDTLRKRYDQSTQVTVSPRGTALTPMANLHRRYDQPLSGKATNMRSSKIRSHNINGMDLVYFEASPDYCNHDPRTGFAGTGGRRCNRTSNGPDGCDSLCCGRGFDTTRQTRTYKCNCRFVYCCDVVCQYCSEWEDVNTCKREYRPEEYPAPIGSASNSGKRESRSTNIT